METLRQTALSLGCVGSENDLQLLQSHLGNGVSKTVFYKAAVHFFSRNIIPRQLVSECCHALGSANQPERRTAATALLRLRQPEHIQPHINLLLTVSRSPDPYIRQTVARLLRKQSFSQKQNLYHSYIADPDWRVRYETAKAIPFISRAENYWISLLKDQNLYVIAAALENPPNNIVWSIETLDIIREHLTSESRSVRSAAITLVYSHSDSVFQQIQRSAVIDEELLPAKIAGIAARLPSREAYETILSFIDHRKKTVATVAYSGIMDHLDSLLFFATISPDEQRRFIIAGLEGGDPVQIYLAANYIFSNPDKTPDVKRFLYRSLEKFRGFQYLESQIMIIRAIEKIHPPDAPAHLRPLLNSQHRQLQEEAYRILTDSYDEKIAPPLPVADPYLYRSLSRLKKYGLDPAVKIETSRGAIVIKCRAYYAPYTVDAFLDRVESGFYDGLSFHRVVPNFVIQAGDPRGDGWGGPDYHLRTERTPISYEPGMVGMASAGPDTEGSQFFITTSPQYHLDYNYTLFGQVTEGMNIVETIEKGDKIISARIIQPSK